LEQQAIAQDALDAKASVRGMQIVARDVILSSLLPRPMCKKRSTASPGNGLPRLDSSMQ
jgi:hypothetical protein